MLRKNENVLRHEVSFGEYNFISFVTKEGILFYKAWIFLRSMKRGEGVFRRKLKNGMYVKFHASQRNKLQ
jgi:hypothetical protein